MTIFMKISEKKIDPFFKTLMTNWGKQMKNLGKMSLIYEFSISKLGYAEISWKTEKKFWLIFV